MTKTQPKKPPLETYLNTLAARTSKILSRRIMEFIQPRKEFGEYGWKDEPMSDTLDSVAHSMGTTLEEEIAASDMFKAVQAAAEMIHADNAANKATDDTSKYTDKEFTEILDRQRKAYANCCIALQKLGIDLKVPR